MKYRKKPVVIEASIFEHGMEDGLDFELPEGVENVIGFEVNDPHDTIVYPYISTLEGKQYISPGDYIITGIEGERYPCKPGIFEKTYEKVE